MNCIVLSGLCGHWFLLYYNSLNIYNEKKETMKYVVLLEFNEHSCSNWWSLIWNFGSFFFS